MYDTNRFIITLSGLILLASVNLVNTSDPTSKNDNANEQHNAITGYFLILLVLCIALILFVLIAITVYCCKVRNDFSTIDLPFSQSEETIRMSIKEHEKSCSSAINIPAPFPKVHSQSVPIPKVRSHSCSDFVPHDESFSRPSYRQPTKKPNINIIIGEETRHCSPFPVPDKMSRRNTVGSRPMRNVRFDTFPCPQRVSKNPFQRQLSLPASVHTELRTEVRSPSNPFKQNDYVQSCPFT